jgi:hypothetical protein
MKMAKMQGDDLKSEPTDKPVKVADPHKVLREEPCLFRKKGLAVWKTPITTLSPEEVAETGWASMEVFSVTHESSGAAVCYFDTQVRAVAALLCALSLTDWTADFATVLAAINADPVKLSLVHALRQGRLEVVRLDTQPTQPMGRA